MVKTQLKMEKEFKKYWILNILEAVRYSGKYKRKRREEVKALLRTGSCECCTQEQQHQHIPPSLFSHPASILFMMFCYYWQGEACILYPASLAGPCFLCFRNGSPHPLFGNQCYQEISKKKMVVAFWHLTIRSMLRGRKQDTSHVSEWPEGSLGRHLSPEKLLEPGALFQRLHREESSNSFQGILSKRDSQEGRWNYSFLWCLLLL